MSENQLGSFSLTIDRESGRCLISHSSIETKQNKTKQKRSEKEGKAKAKEFSFFSTIVLLIQLASSISTIVLCVLARRMVKARGTIRQRAFDKRRADEKVAANTESRNQPIGSTTCVLMVENTAQHIIQNGTALR